MLNVNERIIMGKKFSRAILKKMCIYRLFMVIRIVAPLLQIGYLLKDILIHESMQLYTNGDIPFIPKISSINGKLII